MLQSMKFDAELTAQQKLQNLMAGDAMEGTDEPQIKEQHGFLSTYSQYAKELNGETKKSAKNSQNAFNSIDSANIISQVAESVVADAAVKSSEELGIKSL